MIEKVTKLFILSQPCFIQQLSVEIITHIFARLDPISLATVSKVCNYWRHIVNNDNCCKFIKKKNSKGNKKKILNYFIKGEMLLYLISVVYPLKDFV